MSTIMIGLSVCVSTAGAQTRIEFDFAGADPARNLPWTNTANRAAGWSTTGWTMGAGLLQVDPRDDQLAYAIAASSDLTGLSEALANDAYLAVAITSSNMAGHRVTFAMRREGYHAPLRYAVRSSLDGFAANLFNSALLSNEVDAETFTFLLPVAGWDDLDQPVEFRIIPYAARFFGHIAALTAFRIESAGPARTLALAAGVGGSAERLPDRTLFEEGESVQLRAIPDDGYKFAGWAGALSGRGNPRTISIINDMAITARFARKAPPRMELGTNLDAVNDYTAAWVFKNVFNLARPWLTREVDSFDWESNRTPPLDEDGWPLQIPFVAPDSTSHIVHTLVPLYDAGTYMIRFSGQGMVRLRPPAMSSVDLTSTGGLFQAMVHMAPQPDARTLLLEIHASQSSDPVRDLVILAPGEDPDLAAQPFHSAFIASLAPYRLVRFMDWMRTNGSPLENWTNRTTATSFTQARPEGVSHEFIIQLCNLTGKNAWICIPHRADDDYVRQTARLYRDSLDSNLVLYVEYSNETWNYMPDFTQTPYVNEQAAMLGITSHEFVARRSAEMFAIFAAEFGEEGRHRYVHVLGTQAGFFAGVTVPRVEAFNDPAINPGHHDPDVLAIAPYFGENYTPSDAPFPDAEDMVTTIAINSIASYIGYVIEHKQLADVQGMRLVMYEGGQHFTGIFGAENDDELTERIFAANRDPRMEDRYREYMVALQDAGVDLFAHFNHVAEWSKWGTWGALEYQQQPASEAPKWRALTNWAQQIGDGYPALRLSAPTGSTWALETDLRPDRSYTLSTSTNLIDWTAVEDYTGLRGDDISVHLFQPVHDTPQLFWRIEE